MEINNMIGGIVAIILAILGISSIVFYKVRCGKTNQKNKKGKNISNNQNIQNGNGNIQVGGNIHIKK